MDTEKIPEKHLDVGSISEQWATAADGYAALHLFFREGEALSWAALKKELREALYNSRPQKYAEALTEEEEEEEAAGYNYILGFGGSAMKTLWRKFPLTLRMWLRDTHRAKIVTLDREDVPFSVVSMETGEEIGSLSPSATCADFMSWVVKK